MPRSPRRSHAAALLLLAAVAAPVAAAAQPPNVADTLAHTSPVVPVPDAVDGPQAPDSVRVDSVAGVSMDAPPPSVMLRASVGVAPSDTLPRRDRGGIFGPPPSGFEPLRFGIAVGSIAAADMLIMVGLSDLWYTTRAPWHWYSDAPEASGIPDEGWLDDWDTYAQMDKGGHVFTAWHLARGAGIVGRWTGMSDRAAGWFGGAASIAFQSQIEFLDGYDAAYGASRTDLVANVIGGVIGGIQVAHPEKTAWFTSKIAYHPSPYYDEATSGIGNAIKDYDGLSYWLVAYPSDLGAPRWWPRWLGASLGYGADGLAHPVSGIGEGGSPNGPVHRREYYLSLDLDLLRTGRVPRVLRPLAVALSFLRLPMPALQFGPAGTRLHALYY